MRDFDSAYTLYNDFQRNMERYWCLRWLLQENVRQAVALVLRENLVKFVDIPLVGRIPSLPETPTIHSVLLVEIGEIDCWSWISKRVSSPRLRRSRVAIPD